MSSQSATSNCALDTLTGTYVSSSGNLPKIPTTTLTVRPAPGKSATGTSKWTGANGESCFGEFQGQVRKMSDGQSAGRSVWCGTMRVNGGQENYPFVLVASEDGKRLSGAYWNATGVGGTWDFASA